MKIAREQHASDAKFADFSLTLQVKLAMIISLEKSLITPRRRLKAPESAGGFVLESRVDKRSSVHY